MQGALGEVVGGVGVCAGAEDEAEEWEVVEFDGPEERREAQGGEDAGDEEACAAREGVVEHDVGTRGGRGMVHELGVLVVRVVASVGVGVGDEGGTNIRDPLDELDRGAGFEEGLEEGLVFGDGGPVERGGLEEGAAGGVGREDRGAEVEELAAREHEREEVSGGEALGDHQEELAGEPGHQDGLGRHLEDMRRYVERGII